MLVTKLEEIRKGKRLSVVPHDARSITPVRNMNKTNVSFSIKDIKGGLFNTTT